MESWPYMLPEQNKKTKITDWGYLLRDHHKFSCCWYSVHLNMFFLEQAIWEDYCRQQWGKSELAVLIPRLREESLPEGQSSATTEQSGRWNRVNLYQAFSSGIFGSQPCQLAQSAWRVTQNVGPSQTGVNFSFLASNCLTLLGRQKWRQYRG